MKILLLFLISCTTTIPDIYVFRKLDQRLYEDQETHHIMLRPSPTCMEKINEPYCGYGVSIVTGKEIYIGNNSEHYFNNKSWDILESESVILPAQESYEPLSEYLINSCQKLNCNSDVTKFKVKIDGLTEKENN